MKDQFANYVVQKVLETCDDQQLELILNRIKVHLNALKKYTYGKHIVARVEKLVAAGGIYLLFLYNFYFFFLCCLEHAECSVFHILTEDHCCLKFDLQYVSSLTINFIAFEECAFNSVSQSHTCRLNKNRNSFATIKQA